MWHGITGTATGPSATFVVSIAEAEAMVARWRAGSFDVVTHRLGHDEVFVSVVSIAEIRRPIERAARIVAEHEHREQERRRAQDTSSRQARSWASARSEDTQAGTSQ